MSPAGRPALVRNVHSFETLTKLPNEVVLDTSFVAKALIASEEHHAESAAFMLRLVENDATLYYNRLVEVELAEVAFEIAIVERHGANNWRRHRRDGRVRPRAGRLTAALLQEWRQLLSASPSSCIELDEVSESVIDLMTRHGLGSYDAAHAATAIYVEADGIVTTDAGFGAVPEHDLAIYTSNARMRATRRNRGGA